MRKALTVVLKGLAARGEARSASVGKVRKSLRSAVTRLLTSLLVGLALTTMVGLSDLEYVILNPRLRSGWEFRPDGQYRKR